MQVLIAFAIALCVGLTGIGGGSFTAPALILIGGLSGAEAVGTAFVYSMVVRLVAAPFYLAGKPVHFPYLKLMLLGALPGILGSTYLLASLNTRHWNRLVVIVTGSFARRRNSLGFAWMRSGSPRTLGPAQAVYCRTYLVVWLAARLEWHKIARLSFMPLIDNWHFKIWDYHSGKCGRSIARQLLERMRNDAAVPQTNSTLKLMSRLEFANEH